MTQPGRKSALSQGLLTGDEEGASKHTESGDSLAHTAGQRALWLASSEWGPGMLLSAPSTQDIPTAQRMNSPRCQQRESLVKNLSNPCTLEV